MRRSTLVMVALFAIALIVLLLIQKNPDLLPSSTPTPAATTMVKLLSDWNEQEIVEAVLINADGAQTLLTRNPDNSWNNADAGTVAAGKVEQLLAEMLATNILVKLSSDTALDELGLSAPVQTIRLISDEGRETSILIGSMTPTSSGYYVKVDAQEPCAVSKYAVEAVIQLFAEALPEEDPTPTP